MRILPGRTSFHIGMKVSQITPDGCSKSLPGDNSASVGGFIVPDTDGDAETDGYVVTNGEGGMYSIDCGSQDRVMVAEYIVLSLCSHLITLLVTLVQFPVQPSLYCSVTVSSNEVRLEIFAHHRFIVHKNFAYFAVSDASQRILKPLVVKSSGQNTRPSVSVGP